MNKLLNGLKNETNIGYTTNGAKTYKSTLNKVYDLFAQGGAMRNASNDDCMNLFAEAYREDATLALKCLFFLRDIRGGCGERRFFRNALRWLSWNTKEVKHLIPLIPEFGRWDDLYSLIGTQDEKYAFKLINEQLLLDLDSKTPSLLAKWLKSENTSSKESRQLGEKTRRALGLTAKQYRQMLSKLRARINIVETLMSQNRWDEIEFDKLPSRAGLIYRNAFAHNDITRERYNAFIQSKNTSVHTETLYPYDVVKAAAQLCNWNHILRVPVGNTERDAVNKYWDNLHDYFAKATFNGLAVVDTSGSMTCGSGIHPIDVAISLGLYCAEKAKGPFHNHFISFSLRPKLIETIGVDFCDKVSRIYQQNLCENTNIKATFDLVLRTAQHYHLTQNDLPENLIIISDMQFDRNCQSFLTVMESIERQWIVAGYKMPKLIYWNVNAAYGNNIPMQDKDGITFVSGASPVLFDMIMSGKTGQQLMMDKLMSDRYKNVYSDQKG